MKGGDVDTKTEAPVLVRRLATRREMLSEVIWRYKVDDIVYRAPFTFVRISFRDSDGLVFEGCGFAKQNRYGKRADKWNGNTGKTIATGRAVKELLDHLEGNKALREMGFGI